MTSIAERTGSMTKGGDLSVFTGRDIVIVGLQPWYFPTGCNAKDIALRLAQNNRVLYVNFPIKRKAFFAKEIDPLIERHIRITKDKQEPIREIGPNIWEYYPPHLIESVNWMPYTKPMKVITYFNNRQFAGDIKAACKQLGFKDIIVFNDNDIYNGFFLKELLKPSLYVYYMRDFLQGYSYWRKHVQVLEPQLLRKSDLIVTNSLYYAEYCLPYNPRSYYIGQGCKFDYFDASRQFPIPDDVAGLPGPLVGYIGALDSARLDLSIIRSVALENPDWSIVLVGPEDDTFKGSDLHGIANVHFLGGKPFDLLPAYVQSFDICINPQFSNEITKGNYPLKIDEYLAMGKPVVATSTTAMTIFAGHTYLADRPEEYTALISRALSENTPVKERERIVFAQSHTWENCVLEMDRAARLLINEKVHSQ